MAELQGGSTIGGYQILHGGLKEVYLSGSLTLQGNIKLPSGFEISSGYNSNYILKDHANGNVTLSAAGGVLYLGYHNTTSIFLLSDLRTLDGVNRIADKTGRLYYYGQDTDGRYAPAAIRDDSAKSFRVEVRTSDPASPAVGQMWLRSDL